MLIYGIFSAPLYLSRFFYKDVLDEINGYIAFLILIIIIAVGYFFYFFKKETINLEKNGKTIITHIKSYDNKKYYEIEVNGENYKSTYFKTDSLFSDDKVIIKYNPENPSNNIIVKRVK